MDYQQPHGYMRPPPLPPPPPGADRYQRPPSSVPPPPSNHPWPYSAPQFQYQPQPQHSPSPPPPQWPPSDHSQYLPPHYAAHQPPAYPANPRYPPPHPPPGRPPHLPPAQDWVSGGWVHHQSWQYPSFPPVANANEEDWAAKARAWAAAKAATDNQLGQSQFAPPGRQEEQNHFHDQYSQPTEAPSLDGHAPSAPAPNYQQYPVGQPSRTGHEHLQESQYFASGQPPYAAGMHAPIAVRDGSFAGDSIAPSQHQAKPSICSLTHQQEVPSSYSSVAGQEEAGDRYGKPNSSASLPNVSVSQHQPLPPAGGKSGWMEATHNLLGNQPAEPVTDLSDQPLNFAPHFNRNMDPHAQPIYTHTLGGAGRGGDPAVPISSNYPWNSSVPGPVYPPVPPNMPTGVQVDHPLPIPSPAPGHSTPMFPAGSGFQPTVSMIGPAFGVGAGAPPHPNAFSGDAYGVSDRPKKASVPNWLREEIIKNKSVITSSIAGIPKEDTQSNDDDSNDKYRKGDQTDSRSIDSYRSTEDEDEDEVEAARTAAINKEIKRVLTEVLLKVTDELFDEIATKVLQEDDLSVEVGQDMNLPDNHKLPSTPSASTPKASAKVLISTVSKKTNDENGSEKSTSAAPGDILGLASYASDEEDEEIKSSTKLNPREKKQSSVVTDGSHEETEENRNILAKLPEGIDEKSSVGTILNHNIPQAELNDGAFARKLASSNDHHSSRGGPSGISVDELQHESEISVLRNYSTERIIDGNERSHGTLGTRSSVNDGSQIQNARNVSDKNDKLEYKRSLVKKDRKDSESSEEILDKREGEKHRRLEERHVKTENPSSNDQGREKSRTNEKVKHAESRKRSSPSASKEGTTETQRDKQTTLKNDNVDKRKDKTGEEKEERSRHKSGNESSRRKRYHSSDESSDDSKRKSRHSRRHKSPSPIRSRKRQVSRSPHSKHSKRRHSPYSSLETSRGRPSPSRSRSRSPVHRRR